MSKKRLITYILIPIVFITLLTSGRLFWFNYFKPTTEPTIENGILDLRKWDFTSSPTFSLDGTWQFAPYELFTTADEFLSENVVAHVVPHDWSRTLNPENHSPFGYGSYHLRILTNPEQDIPLSARVSSIRSSSFIYANGHKIGGSGEVQKTNTEDTDFNVPYTTSTIRSDTTGVIDLVIQVANHSDPRNAGIIRSILFGDEDVILHQTELSVLLQIVAMTFFFVFFLLCFMLYLVGWKDRRILYFALVLGMMIVNLSGGDDKLLIKFLGWPYHVNFKLLFSVFISVGLILVHTVRPKAPHKARYLFHIHTAVGLATIALYIWLPVTRLTYAAIFSLFYLVVSIAVLALMFFLQRKQVNGGILLSLAALAFIHQFIWFGLNMAGGLKTMYYPFDIMIGLSLLAAVWFKNYYQTYRDTQLYAEKLLLADKVRDEFLANTSHELRNPLNAILNISEAVLKREQRTLDPTSTKDLETVQAVGRRMVLMLNDLLDFTRIKEQQPKMTFTAVSLHQLMNHSIDIVRFMTSRKTIRFVNKVPCDFPLVLADEHKLQQILFNLLHNAVKFTPKGTITLSAAVIDGCVHVYVHDTGQGMSQQTSQKIFDAYYQEQTNEGGFGIGLSLTKKLIELHGGTIEVTSTLGTESTFRFTLPLASDDDQALVQAATTEMLKENLYAEMNRHRTIRTEVRLQSRQGLQEKRNNQKQQTNKRVLVVDDDPINLQVIRSIFSGETFKMTTVLSGAEALEKMNQTTWDLVITDVMMPQMTGYELVEKLRERFSLSELPIILLTARASETEIEYGFSIGANDYVTKPVAAVELTSRVHTLLDMKTSADDRLEMEAAWLQAQIQPHFLFNTLNTIFALSELDVKRMQKLLEAFNVLLRQKFQFRPSNDFWTIQEEIDIVKSYVYIEQERFGERVTIEWDIDEHLPYHIPTLSIQPLVENAIRHGILKKEFGGKLTIRVKSFETYGLVEIIDDGVGMSQETIQNLFDKTKQDQYGVGISNVHARLIRLFGEPLTIESTLGKGTKMSFKVYHVE